MSLNWLWHKMNLFSTENLEAWHHSMPGLGGHSLAPDYSRHGRDASCDPDNAPGLTPNVQGGQPGWYFNGTNDPLASAPSAFTARHIFCVASVEYTTFPVGTNGFKGLLSGLTTGDILVGDAGTDKWFDYAHTEYRKSNILYAPNDQKAPVSNVIAILEVINEVGINCDGIQIGQQRGFTARKHKGFFLEDIIFSSVKNFGERMNIYRYLALRYKLWRRKNDLNVFPFDFNRPTRFEEDDLAEISEAEGERASDRVIRYLDDEPTKTMVLQFNDRRTIEEETARVFTREHRLHLPFYIEDRERDDEDLYVRTSSVWSNGVGTFSRSYGFNVKNYPTVISPTDPPPTAPGAPSYSAVTINSMHVEWTPATDNSAVVSYQLQRAKDFAFTLDLQIYSDIPTDTLEFDYTGLESLQNYCSRVRAKDDAGQFGPWSPVSSEATLEGEVELPDSVYDQFGGAADTNLNTRIADTLENGTDGWHEQGEQVYSLHDGIIEAANPGQHSIAVYNCLVPYGKITAVFKGTSQEGGGIILRRVDANNFLSMYFAAGNIALYKCVAGVYTEIPSAIGAGDTVVEDSVVEVLMNDDDTIVFMVDGEETGDWETDQFNDATWNGVRAIGGAKWTSWKWEPLGGSGSGMTLLADGDGALGVDEDGSFGVDGEA